MPRHLGPGGTQLPRHMGPPGPKIGGDPYACDTGVIGIRVPPNNCPAGQLFLGSIVRRTRLPRKEGPPRTLPPRNRCPPPGVCVPQT